MATRSGATLRERLRRWIAFRAWMLALRAYPYENDFLSDFLRADPPPPRPQRVTGTWL